MYIGQPTAVDGIGLLIGDLDAEFLGDVSIRILHCSCSETNLLNSHDNLYGVETVQSEVVVEVGLGVELSRASSVYGRKLGRPSSTLEVSWTCDRS
jgi:hypothetical protein